MRDFKKCRRAEKRAAIHICHSSFSSRSVHRQQAQRGRERRWGGEEGKREKADGEKDRLTVDSSRLRLTLKDRWMEKVCWYQGAWSIDGPESLSSKSLGSLGSALGSGNLGLASMSFCTLWAGLGPARRASAANA